MAHQPTQAAFDAVFRETRQDDTRNWGWFLALGILLVLVGIAAIVFPFASTLATKIVLGWVLLIAGIGQIVHAFYVKRWAGFFWNLIIGLLYLLVGIWLAFFPLAGIFSLTIILAALFIADGIMEIAMSFRMRPHEGWGWVLFSGIVAIAAGVLILISLPYSAIWALGLLAGIKLLVWGWSFIFLALTGKSMSDEPTTRTT